MPAIWPGFATSSEIGAPFAVGLKGDAQLADRVRSEGELVAASAGPCFQVLAVACLSRRKGAAVVPAHRGLFGPVGHLR
jgi:hypothetical protein